MLVVPQEEWQSLHEKLDRLTELVDKILHFADKMLTLQLKAEKL